MNNVHTCKPLFCLLGFQGRIYIILHFIALFGDGAEKSKIIGRATIVDSK